MEYEITMDLEQWLRNEWTVARDRAKKYYKTSQELAKSENVDSKTIELYERLSQLEAGRAMEILEIIYDFTK